MIVLGFVMGWCAASYWWPWVLSFYEKPPVNRNGVEIANQGTASWRRNGP